MFKIFKRPKILLIIIALLSFLGFLDAAYLTIKHYQGILPPCSVSGCENVLTSRYASVGSLPISLLGSIYYVAVITLSIVLLQIPYSHSRPPPCHSREGGNLLKKSALPANWIPAFARMTMGKVGMIKILILLIFSGFFVSVILFLIQALIIHSFCQYCLFSEAVSIFLLIFSIILLRLYKGTGYRE